MLKKRQIVDVTTLDPKHRSLPIKGEPGSIVDLVENGTVMQRRIFGYDGKAIVDFDTTDHNQPSQHPTGAHKHIFDYSKRNPHGPHRKISDQELEMNQDIIQKGVNYFDEERID